VLSLKFLGDNADDPRQVASMPLYQAHLALRMEYARKRIEVRRLMEVSLFQSETLSEVAKLISCKKPTDTNT
jgi:hypothetical protein